jgi:multiple sugar transport system ATP-binding protein
MLRRKPRELSGGERQRVALGRAMVRHPSVFLFDEPLSNLDAKLRVQMRVEIHRLHRRLEATMVYVTHDQVEAMTLGERIAVLDKGRLQQCADPHTLYHHPANRFVAGFIGSPPMNFLPARIEQGGQVSVAGAPGFVPSPAPPALERHRGRDVTLGVRPENLLLMADGQGSSIDAKLEVREPLGNETLLYWSTEGGPLVSRLTGDPAPEPGSRHALHFRHDRLRWFDPTDGSAIDEVPATS